jgi:hypothetical protein
MCLSGLHDSGIINPVNPRISVILFETLTDPVVQHASLCGVGAYAPRTRRILYI